MTEYTFKLESETEGIMQYATISNGLTVPVWTTLDLTGAIAKLQELYAKERALIEEVSALAAPTYYDLFDRFEAIGEQVSRITNPIGHQYSTRRKDFDGIKEISDKIDEMSSEQGSFITQHVPYYEAHLRLRDSKEFATLDAAQKYMLTKAIKSFERSGISLSKKEQERVAEIRKELAQLGSDFEDATVHATDGWEKFFPDATGLEGLLPVHLEMFAAHAASKGGATKGGYLISLQPSHVEVIMSYASDRELRKEVREANVTRASDAGPNAGKWDNGPRAVRMLALRKELADILGFSSWNAYSIDTKMAAASGVNGVEIFQESIATAARAKAVVEWSELEAFARERLGVPKLDNHDVAIAWRLLQESRLDLDDEEVRRYFPLSKVWAGFADRIQALFGATFVKVEDDSVTLPHESAEFYEVRDENGKVIAGFYADLFSREGKRGGAWMDSCMNRFVTRDGHVQYPIGYLCANFRPPVSGKDAYLSHDEVNTLFHEGGHEFHLMLTKVESLGASMHHIEWDTVELPSQYMEEWSYDPDTLRAMSAHEATGEAIPFDVITKIRASRHFNAGLMYARQSVFGIFDWRAHKLVPSTPEELIALYRETVKEFDMRPVSEVDRVPMSFGHIFPGGYSAGYFSYLWALGLVADVVSAFEEAETEYGPAAQSAMYHRYRDEILAVGSARPFVESFRKFRGRDLDPDKLIAYLGLA